MKRLHYGGATVLTTLLLVLAIIVTSRLTCAPKTAPHPTLTAEERALVSEMLAEMYSQKAEPESEPEPVQEPATAQTLSGPVEPEPVKPSVEPEPVELYDVPLDAGVQLYLIDLCEGYGIDPAVVMGVIKVESNYNVTIMGDRGHAYGLMQVQPRWHGSRIERLGVTDLLDPCQNVAVGVDYLAELVADYDGNIEMALVAYNAGPAGAYNGWFSVGVYSSDYSRQVLSAAAQIIKGE